MSLSTLLVLAYSSAAIPITTDEQFAASIRQNSSGEFILHGKIGFAEEKDLGPFRGVLDGKDNILHFEAPVFDNLVDCLIRDVTLQANRNLFAREAVNAKFIAVRFLDTSISSIDQSNIQQSWIQSDFIQFANISDSKIQASVINGSVAHQLMRIKNVQFGNVSLNFTQRIAEYITDSSFAGCRLERESVGQVAQQGIAFDIETTVFSKTDYYFGVHDSSVSFSGMATNLVSTAFSYFSVAANCSSSQLESFQMIGLQLIGADLHNVSFFYQVKMSADSAVFFGIAQASPGSNITHALQIGNVSVRATLTATAAMGYSYVNQYSFVHRLVINCVIELHINRSANFSLFAFDITGNMSEVAVMGNLSVDIGCLAKGNQEIFGLARSYFGIFKNSYSSLNVEIVNNQAEYSLLTFAFGAFSCSGCVFQSVAVLEASYKGTGTQNLRFGGLAIVADATENAIRQAQFAFCQVNASVLVSGAQNQLAGFIFYANSVAVTSSFVNINIESEDSLAFGLFYYCFDGSGAQSQSNIGTGRSETVRNAGITVIGSGDLQQYFINCDSEIFDSQIATCHKEDDMKHEQFLKLLAPDFQQNGSINQGYPHSVNCFQMSSEGMIISNNTETINASLWYAANLLLFPQLRNYEFCRGQCMGKYFSPVDHRCESVTDPICLTFYVPQKFAEDLCVADKKQTCNRGQAICRVNYEIVGRRCVLTCVNHCMFGKCLNGECVCDLYYGGDRCSQLICDLQSVQCFGLGVCVQANDTLECQCDDPAAVFSSEQCFPDECPGLLAYQGICTLNGPQCFSPYAFDGKTCNACIKGYTMDGGYCVKEKPVSVAGAIAGSVCAGLFGVAFIFFVIWLVLQQKKANATADELEILNR